MGSPRTRIDVEQAVLWYRQGWTLRRIAAKLGCSFQRLSTLLRDQPGVEMRTPSHPRAPRLPEAKRAAIRSAIGEGLNASEISRRVGVTVAAVTLLADKEQLRLQKGRRLTWDLKHGQALRAQGLSYQRVAAELGVSTRAVWSKLRPLEEPAAGQVADIAA
ncbi:hypothetical protein [Nonomuraea dietziae]|uniref:hypothetical protein n=1 Tax=Nonomuraea dietziae TaxID=65515 RepID=UPI0033E2D11E